MKPIKYAVCLCYDIIHAQPLELTTRKEEPASMTLKIAMA